MNKIEELENKLKEEKNKMQANLKENYKLVVGKYVKFDEYSIMRIDNLRLIISNQGGIEKGFVDREMFEYKFDYISNALEDYTDISVSAYYCDSNNKRNANRKPNTGMIKQYMDFVEYMNDDEDEEEKIVYDTILMIGDASGKEGQFSDSDKKTAENFGCEYMDVNDFVYKYNNR